MGERVDSSDVKKHKKDILRISTELMLNQIEGLPKSVYEDICIFIDTLKDDPFDSNSLKNYGVSNEDVVELLNRIYREE